MQHEKTRQLLQVVRSSMRRFTSATSESLWLFPDPFPPPVQIASQLDVPYAIQLRTKIIVDEILWPSVSHRVFRV